MPDDKKDPNADPKGDDKGDDLKGKDLLAEKDAKIEELTKLNGEQDTALKNLTGTQSATTKALNDIKTKFGAMEDKFKEAGIDTGDIDKLVATNNRNAAVLKVIADTKADSRLIPYIKGNTEEEMKASITDLTEMMGDNAKKAKEDADKEAKDKKDIKHNDKKVTKMPDQDVKDQAKAFIESRGLTKKAK